MSRGWLGLGFALAAAAVAARLWLTATPAEKPTEGGVGTEAAGGGAERALEPRLVPRPRNEAEAGDFVQEEGLHLSELNRGAIAKLEAGDLEGAVADFERCVEGEPEESTFRENLAEALARLARARHEDGEVAEAIELLGRAVELAPRRTGLADLLERWRTTAETEEDFWTDETAHFLLSYDGGRSDVLRYGYVQLEEMLEGAYEEFGLALNHYPVGHGDPKVRVVLYRREEFAEITGVGHWAGGVYDGVVRIPLGDYERQKRQLERVLRHEVLHAFLRSLGGKQVPGWLNEGLAQWFEEPTPAGRQADVRAARELLDGHELFDLETLRGTLATWEDEGRIALGYAQSLAFVDYLASWYGESVLFEMVAGCREGRDCGATFEGRIGVPLGDVLEDWKRSLD